MYTRNRLLPGRGRHGIFVECRKQQAYTGFSTATPFCLAGFRGTTLMTRESSPSKYVQSSASWQGLSTTWLIDVNCGVGFMVWLSLHMDWYEVDGLLIGCCNLSVWLTVLSTSRSGLLDMLSYSYSLISYSFFTSNDSGCKAKQNYLILLQFFSTAPNWLI